MRLCALLSHPNMFPSKAHIDVSGCGQSALRSMAGNGMTLPSAGFMLLMMVLFCEDNN